MVGISGGVDSALACALLKEASYDVSGCNINFIDEFDNPNLDAIEVTKSINIPYYHINLYNEFKDKVIDNFVYSYNNGLTPNPCVLCNKFFKFGVLLDFAINNGYDYIATGHYARIEYSEKYGRYIIRKAFNLKKDQSYFLYGIDKKALSHIIFPLSQYDSKDLVREKALDFKLSVAKKKDSLDVCFIPNKDYRAFLLDNNYVTLNKGDIVLKESGRVLGTHNGLFNYTIGQRKGLGIAYEKPLYVIGFDYPKNLLIVGFEEELYHKEIIVGDVNLLLYDKIEDGMRLNVRIRYQGHDAPASLYNTDEGIKVVFDEPQKSPTRGQSAVFYLDDILVGGGIIK